MTIGGPRARFWLRGATTGRRFVGRITMFFSSRFWGFGVLPRAWGCWPLITSRPWIGNFVRHVFWIYLWIYKQEYPCIQSRFEPSFPWILDPGGRTLLPIPIPLHIFSSPRVFPYARRLRIGSSGLPLIACWFATERIGIPTFLPMTGRCFAYQSITLRNSKA